MRPAATLLAVLALTETGCFYNPTVTGSTQTSDAGTTDTADPTSTPTTTLTEVCGDGELDPGEQCDDSNTVNGDGCEDDCSFTPALLCGNGEIDGGEECDDGNDDSTDACTEGCKVAFCGDGAIQAGVETCDDGNDDESDDCLSTCVAASCGDGQLHDGVEACDNGRDNDDTAYTGCTTQCQLGPRCGDGVTQQVEGEQCDDGTPDGDDLCNACINTPRRYLFITSQTFSGDLTSLDLADDRCVIAATELPASIWTAWLSDDSDSPYARMDTAFVGWYVLPGPDTILVARNWAGLASGTLLHPINRDEFGNPIAADARAWSNTDIDGKILSLDMHCSNWDSNTGMGNIGDPHAADATWTNAQSTSDCSTPQHLYCIQNSPDPP